MYTNELIPRQIAQQAVNDYALLYTKIEGSKQYFNKRYDEALKARNAFKKALSQLIGWAIPTAIFALIALIAFLSNNIVLGVVFTLITLIVVFKWTISKLIKFLKSLKLNKFANSCASEFLLLNGNLGGKNTDVWSNAFRNELISLVEKYMYYKYDDVNKRISAFNQKYAEYRDFVNLNNQWSKTPVLAAIFDQGLATSIVEALREYERKKDADEIKGMQRATIKALDNVSHEMQSLNREIKANTAATLAGVAAVGSLKPSIDSNTAAIKDLNNTLNS